MACSHGSLCIINVHVCVPVFVCIYFCLLREKEKADNVGAQSRKGFKIRLGCKGGNSSEGNFLLLLFLGSGFCQPPQSENRRAALGRELEPSRCWITGLCAERTEPGIVLSA